MKIQLVCILAMALFACGNPPGSPGTNTGNGIVSVSMGATSSLNSSTSMPGGQDAQETLITLDEARIAVSQIQFQLPDGEECQDVQGQLDPEVVCDGNEIELEGPFIFDLLTRTSIPEVAELVLPARTYTRVKVTFERSELGDGLLPAGDPLLDQTIVASGIMDYGQDPLGLEVSLVFSEETVVDDEEGFLVNEGDVEAVSIELDVAEWFAGLPLTQCLNDGDLTPVDNTLTVNDGTGYCSDVENGLKDAIKDSAELDEED